MVDDDAHRPARVVRADENDRAARRPGEETSGAALRASCPLGPVSVVCRTSGRSMISGVFLSVMEMPTIASAAACCHVKPPRKQMPFCTSLAAARSKRYAPGGKGEYFRARHAPLPRPADAQARCDHWPLAMTPRLARTPHHHCAFFGQVRIRLHAMNKFAQRGAARCLLRAVTSCPT